MRDAPDLILRVVGREQTVVHGGADLNNGTGHAFPEASLVTDLFQVGGVGNEDELFAENFDTEDPLGA